MADSAPFDAPSADAAELEARISTLRDRMVPLEAALSELRAERDQLLTEIRRRERLAAAGARRDLKVSMKAGEFPTVGDLVGASAEGSFDDFVFNLKTGGEVRLGFPLARSQTIAFTDGRQVAQAHDLAEAAKYFEAGWELGVPGRPGVRVHMVGTRTERLVDAGDVHARPRG